MLHLLLLAGYQVATASVHPNLIVNGDFSQGNKGFTSAYSFNSDLGADGSYYVGSNPHDYHQGGASFSAHSGPQGMMLIVNGSSTADTTIWEQSVRVQPNHRYYFGVWAASWGQGSGNGDPNPARLLLSVNGKTIGIPLRLRAQDGLWTKYVATWDSGSSQTANLRIVDDNTEWFGNDFAISDLVFHD